MGWKRISRSLPFGYDGLGRQLSPFLSLDYASHKFSPGSERRGFSAHPHKGFEAVTICNQGEVKHRDSSGGGGIIGPGDVQWMTAGSGIVHEEFQSDAFTRRGGTLQMVQLWVNLRAMDKNAPPSYQTLRKTEIPIADLPKRAGNVRIISGDYDGQRGPARTFTPINLWDVSLVADTVAHLPLPNGHTSAIFVIEGDTVVSTGRLIQDGDLAIFERTGDGIEFHTKKNARLLVMDGQSIDEPIVGRGPFVMNSRAEIQQAVKDYKAGRFGELN